MKKVFFHTILFALFMQFVPVIAQEATLLGRWYDDELIGSNVYNNIYNEIWGLHVNGKEYAVIGSTAGTHIIDLSDPSDPVQIHFIEGAVSSGEIIHRDYDDFNGYLYAVADEGLSTLQIIDIRNLPDSAPVVYDSDALIRRTHNIFIDGDSKRMYAFHTRGSAHSYAPMRIFDISDPVAPEVIVGYEAFGGTNIGHVHDGYVRDNIAFMNCGYDGFYIVDFTDAMNPVMLSSITEYPDNGYNHSGWLSDDGNHYYMADENHGAAIKVINVENPCEAGVTGTFDAGAESAFSITHNQIAACDYLYTSYYYDGLQVFDISDRANPVKVLEFDTYDPANNQSYKGAWGIFPLLPSGMILVSDMQSGLYVFEGVGDNCHSIKDLRELDDPCNPQTPTGLTDISYTNGTYPQPVRAGSTLFIEPGELNSGIARMELISIDGRRIQQWSPALSTNDIQLEIDGKVIPGMYLLIMETEQGRSSRPVIVAGE